jgi:hypothetical protein
MQKISFILSLPGTIKLDGDKMTITISRTQTTLNFSPSQKSDSRLFLDRGQTIFDIILNTAQELVTADDEEVQFTAADLYHLAVDKYPYIKRNSWTAHVIASAPNHTSYRHYGVKKDYFRYLGDGNYQLDPKYIST